MKIIIFQSVLSVCHAMPQINCVPVVLSGGKYQFEFETNGTSSSSAVAENAWRYISAPK
jgi:hypothetical protein